MSDAPVWVVNNKSQFNLPKHADVGTNKIHIDLEHHFQVCIQNVVVYICGEYYVCLECKAI